MFPELKKKKYQMADPDARALLSESVYGVLSLLSENGYCYGVPLHHVLVGDALYFHCASRGEKLTAAACHGQVCYTVVGDKLLLMEGKLDTRYSSVCAFGAMGQVESKEEKVEVLRALVEKYDPSSRPWIENYVKGEMPVSVWKLTIEHLSGKSSFLEGDV